MKSKASLKSHPLHPVMVGFPIAFFTGALAFDLLFLFAENPSFRSTGYHLVIAGIIGALLAAVPGLIDFRYTVPPQSSARKRAAKHGLLNTANLLLFVAVLFLKRNGNASFTLTVLLEAAGVLILCVAGWLGGTLVYRNQLGVDPRYADAGKWNEAYLSAGSDPVKVAAVEELRVNQMKLVHLEGKRIVIARTEKGYAAFDDRCSHKGGSLAGGALICSTVQCPWHGSQFDVHTGLLKAGPATEPVQTYPVAENEDGVYLVLTETKI